MIINVSNAEIESFHTKENMDMFIIENSTVENSQITEINISLLSRLVKKKKWYKSGYVYYKYILFLIMKYLKHLDPIALETGDINDGINFTAYKGLNKYLINYLNDDGNDEKRMILQYENYDKNNFKQLDDDDFDDHFHLVENSFLDKVHLQIYKIRNLRMYSVISVENTVLNLVFYKNLQYLFINENISIEEESMYDNLIIYEYDPQEDVYIGPEESIYDSFENFVYEEINTLLFMSAYNSKNPTTSLERLHKQSGDKKIAMNVFDMLHRPKKKN